MQAVQTRRRGYFDRKALDPRSYYRKIFVEQLSKTARDGWIQVRCVFHDDHNPSLSVNLIHGGYKCFSCGAKGDLLSFHMRKHNLPFIEAAKSIGAWKYA